VVIGAAFIAVGLARGDAIPMMLIGGALILWTLIAIAAGRR
jgi:hypothetical protein